MVWGTNLIWSRGSSIVSIAVLGVMPGLAAWGGEGEVEVLAERLPAEIDITGEGQRQPDRKQQLTEWGKAVRPRMEESWPEYCG